MNNKPKVRPVFANRMSNLAGAASHAVIGKVREMRGRGIDVIDFGKQGHTPSIAKDAAFAMMNSPLGSTYTDTRGIKILRDTIATKLSGENGITADPDAEICVTIGAKEAIFATLLALVGEGDEVLIEDPSYVGFEPLVRLTGATPVLVPLLKEDGFRFPVDRLEHYITANTRLLLLCNPHNPGGRCRSAEDLMQIGEIARKADILVLVDEAYEHYVYDGVSHVSMASLPGMFERTITVQTVSKIYNMSGWRIGWAAAPQYLMDKIHIAHTHAITCATATAQAGAQAVIKAGIGEGDLPIARIVANYSDQRNAMVGGLNAIAGVSCQSPNGAFFTFPDISSFGMTSIQLSNYLLDDAHVASTPGSVFGPNGEGHIRLVFKSDIDTINRGIKRISDALMRLDRAGPSS